MAKLNPAQIHQLKKVLSDFFDSSTVNSLMVRNNHSRLWKAYQNRTMIKIPINGQTAKIDFTTLADETEQHPVKSLPSALKKVRGKSKKPVKKVTSVALDPDMFERLKILADEKDISTGYLIRLALKQYLDRQDSLS